MIKQTRLDLEHIVSEKIGINQVEGDFHKMGRAEVLRSVPQLR